MYLVALCVVVLMGCAYAVGRLHEQQIRTTAMLRQAEGPFAEAAIHVAIDPPLPRLYDPANQDPDDEVTPVRGNPSVTLRLLAERFGSEDGAPRK